MSVPIFVSRVSFTAMKTTDVALLGHAGAHYLDAASLSDLWTSSTGVFVMSRVLGTFCGQAFGAGNKMLVGIWLQVSYAVLLVICIFVALAWCMTGPVLRAFHVEERLVQDAQYFALVLMLCLPARIAFSQLTTFFSSQRMLRPGMISAMVAMVANLVLGLFFVLGVPVPRWSGLGFPACPWVTTVVEYLQVWILWYTFCYRQRLHYECWPGWSMQHLTRERVCAYFQLYWPSALAIGESYWRTALIGAVAASLSERNVGVWNAGYHICWIFQTFLVSIAGAMGVKLSNALGAGQVEAAKQVCRVAVAMILAVLCLLAVALLSVPQHTAAIFSHEEEFISKFVEVRWPFTFFVSLQSTSVAIETILLTAGRNRTVLAAGLISSWLGQVPLVLVFTSFWRRDLYGLYCGVAAGYALMFVLYAYAILRLDWEQLVVEARLRSEFSSRLHPQSTRVTSWGLSQVDEEPLEEES